MSERGIAPGLLLAMPQMGDPNFRRSVVLMVEHNAEQSFGLVVNRPSEVPVSEVMTPLGVSWREADARVFMGGPVAPGSGWLLHEPVDYALDDATLDNLGLLLVAMSGDAENVRAWLAAAELVDTLIE